MSCTKRQRLPMKTQAVRYTPSNIRRLKWKERVSPDVWATRHYILEKESAIGGGTYSFDYAPHAQLPLKYLGKDTISTITLVFASQTGKTTIGMVFLNYSMDIEGGNIMFFLPDEKLIPFTATDRILPSILRTKNAEGLEIEKEERKTRDNTKNIRYPNGVIRVVSSTSATNRKSTPSKRIILDEASEMKYEHVEEIKERIKTFEMYGGKMLLTSTPMYKNDPILLSYSASEIKFKYAAKCPTCKKSHFDDILTNLIYPTKDEITIPDEIMGDERHLLYCSIASKQAKYKCPHCGDLWDTKKKNQAVKLGGWESVGMKIENPTSAGFMATSFISMFVSIEKIAQEYLKADTDDKKIVFYRGWLAQIYEPEIKSTPKEEILKLKCDLEERKLPDDCIGLVASIDVQKGHYYYSAIGVDKNLNPFIVEYGRLESEADLQMFVCFTHYDGQYPEMIAIDSGYETSTIYEFCIRMNDLMFTDEGVEVYKARGGQPINIVPIKGSRNATSTGMDAKSHITKIEKNPSTGTAYKDSFSLHTINTYYYKENVNLHIEKGIKGYEHNRLYIHKNMMDDICESLVSEHKIQKVNTAGNLVYKYEPIKAHPFNHYFDTMVYNMYLVDMLDMVRRTMSYTTPEEPQATKEVRQIDYMDEF